MSINAIKRRNKLIDNDSSLPTWVSSKNVSLKAYNCINRLKLERLEYISKNNKSKDYIKKSLYQISASEIARIIGAATTTLISTSAYSSGLKSYLDETNQILIQEKEAKLIKHVASLNKGIKQRKKDEIVEKFQEVRTELELLKKLNASEQVEYTLKSLPLPIKQKLGLNL